MEDHFAEDPDRSEDKAAGRRWRVALGRLLLIVLTLCSLAIPVLSALGHPPAAVHAQQVPSETLRDYDVVNGYFFTETGGSRGGDQGYSLTDDGGVPLWDEFQRLGGVDTLGYPVTRRFIADGFLVQATQKVVLQWRPDTGQMVYANVLDDLSRAGKDDWLLSFRQIPKPAAFPEEAALTFDQIVQNRMKLLDAYPPLRAAYLAAPDPVQLNGLPVAPVADEGPMLVLRAQRRAFQLWKVATPFAKAGDVTVVNAGDLGKDAGLYPAAATQPEAAASQIATPPGSAVRLSADDATTLHQVVERARPAVVELTDNASGLGSGFVFDPSGLIMTNSHVVTSLKTDRLRAVFPDGRSFPAHPVGADDWTDVAVVKIDGVSNLPSLSLGSAQSLELGQRVIGIGYAPVFPGPPSAKTGVVRSLAGEIQTFHDFPLFNLVMTNTYLHPGDSGGPLLNMAGQVVGVNSAIRVARRGQDLAGFSIPAEGAKQIADQLISSGTVPRPQLGISVEDVTPSMAQSLGLPVSRGVIVRQLAPESPAAVAGIQSGDVIVGMDGQDVTSLDDLRRLMIQHKIGDTVPFLVVSANGAQRTVSVTLTERPPLV